MKRRNFIKRLVAFAGAAAIPASTIAKVVPVREIQLLDCNIAGFSYYEGEKLIPDLCLLAFVNWKQAK